ncbi:heterocyst frequency control protein PatD [Oculatella sp. FACHB-28]|uniref:heterocyst frequency control protein PatD n=1 Tax=Cyanophyceae TaxID=3028117 RepID=UPI0016881E30|nr:MULTISPECIES: heterocyst frequency control protein PatD [Cyanophyceae]MBD1871483.1 heterocyst frequency control protein PatD [Cyanobacteria bacterium FACHB-471]MBD1996037.1 heterocyst frequency control protein PatD [Leptolyngbya sp. FACHB-541]MBD2057199.1 heterocyst frequency control protein PatD [Oculatella sp. FACHB-28]MBD2072241.1 heterocyst frequency control protein PatD [Leptolyngbya sp. FACHB-671]
MLSGLSYQHYQQFQNALRQLKLTVTRSNPDLASLHADFLEVQQMFQLRIMGTDLDQIDPAVVSQVQSYQTEINKQMRLLGMDVMFLQAARQPTTAQQRQAQMSDRIVTLIRYCDALLGSE